MENLNDLIEAENVENRLKDIAENREQTEQLLSEMSEKDRFLHLLQTHKQMTKVVKDFNLDTYEGDIDG